MLRMTWNATRTLCIDGFGPLPVVRPTSIAEVQEIVRHASARGEAIYPVGGGTLLNLGWTPTRSGVVVDLTALDQIVDYPARDMTITVHTGISIEKLQATLAREKQRLPVDVPLPQRSTLGGAMAANVSGPRRFGFGTLRDYVIGISVINDRGEVVKAGGRVVKNVAGYDLCKLYVGSLGTLGIIVQTTLKVRPLPEASALAAVPVAWDRCSELLDRLNRSRTRPCAVELLSPPAAQSLVGSQGNTWLVLVGYEDNRSAVDWQLDQMKRELADLGPGVEATWRNEEAAPLWSRLADWPLTKDATIVFKASVLPSQVASLCQVASEAVSEVELLAHAGNGIVLGRIPDGSVSLASELLSRLRQEAQACRGSVVLVRCLPELKPQLDVWGTPQESWSLMAAVKAQLDPADVFNPGRYVVRPPGSLPSPR